jgi:hypothetical protein
MSQLPYRLGSGGICPKCDSDNTTYSPECAFRTCEDCGNIWGRDYDDPDYEDPDYDQPVQDYGPCCNCGNANAINFLMLQHKAPIPGTGWGCLVCNLPNDGALAVVCDECIGRPLALRTVILGYPNSKGRTSYSSISATNFCHTMELHEREEQQHFN